MAAHNITRFPNKRGRLSGESITGSTKKGSRRTAIQPPRDPCQAALDLLRTQVIFIKAATWGVGLWNEAPAYGIDPEFWNPAACAYALEIAKQATSRKKRP